MPPRPEILTAGAADPPGSGGARKTASSLSGLFAGLCRVLGSSTYPPLAAAELAARLLGRTRRVSRRYRRHLRRMRAQAVAAGEPPDVLQVLEECLDEPLLPGRLLGSVDFEELLGPGAWDRCGPHLVPIWAAVFVMVAVTVDLRERALPGVGPASPERSRGEPPEAGAR